MVDLTHISFDHIIDFMVEVRGQCWIPENIEIKSAHRQWYPLINEIFVIANDHGDSAEMKKSIQKYLQKIKSVSVNIT